MTEVQSKKVINKINNNDIGITNFENISGTVNENVPLNMQDAMQMLYHLSNSVIISESEPPAPENGKGFWLDTSDTNS